MSLHPHLQLQVGDREITSVPPNFLQKLSYKSALGSLSTIDFTIIDPSFTEIEQLLLLSDTNDEPVFSRFGYLDEAGNVTSKWLQSRIINIVPHLTVKGMELTVSSLVDVGGEIALVKGRTYSGRISRVVKQIADDMGVDSEIEETNDDDNEVSNDGSPKLWLVNNMDLITFVKTRLRPVAKSKSSPSSYDFWISGSRTNTRKPILHFHTRDYVDCSERKKSIKEFTYLLGANDEVIDFSPSYNSSLLGNIGGGQVVMRNYDFIKKQYVTRVENTRNNTDATSIGDGSQTTSKAVSEAGENEDTVSQAIYMAREDKVATAEARSQAIWDLLRASSFTAALTLVGLPTNTDLEANELVRVNVVIPSPPGSVGDAYRSHWSSGVYMVTEAIHEIEGQYVINCQLQRDASSFGPGEAPLGKIQA